MFRTDFETDSMKKLIPADFPENWWCNRKNFRKPLIPVIHRFPKAVVDFYVERNLRYIVSPSSFQKPLIWVLAAFINIL
jgi:hypothetical protein